MICPHCSQRNPENYIFCASCGARLAQATSPVPPASAPGTQPPASSLRIQPVDHSPAQPVRPVRDLRYLLEDDEPPKSRIAPVIVVISLLALGAFAWWELRPMLQTETGTSSKSSSEPSPGLASKVSPDPPPAVQKASPAESPQSPAQADAPSSAPADNSTTKTEISEAQQPGDEAVPPAPSIDETQKQEARSNPPGLDTSVEAPPRSKMVSKAPPVLSKPVPKPPPDVIKQAEAYLYGRGVPQNCERALSMLKGEADKSNARARSALGSMYATGHCVSRDLPTAYRYFALVLRTDPENGVAAQNLEALWKQMTPPERQAATRQ